MRSARDSGRGARAHPVDVGGRDVLIGPEVEQLVGQLLLRSAARRELGWVRVRVRARVRVRVRIRVRREYGLGEMYGMLSYLIRVRVRVRVWVWVWADRLSSHA